jgi:transposase
LNTALRIAELEKTNAQLIAQMATLTQQFGTEIAALRHQLEWFQRQLFGAKSEKQLAIDPAVQGNLLGALGVLAPPTQSPPLPEQAIAYTRRAKVRDAAQTDSGLRFDATVPVETIEVLDPAIEAIPEGERERIGEKVTYRLAQRPGSYAVLKYVRTTWKLRETGELLTPPSPSNVLEKCVADVSLLAGMLSDKFLYHLPLHRQHQRLLAAGVQLSRASLTTWAARGIDLLAPIYAAQCRHVLTSEVLAMDETPIKAGRLEKGKMRQAYFWPIYGNSDEVVFHYAPSRAHEHVKTFLGTTFTGTLLTDGYEAYRSYARSNPEVTHAECWAHCRRHFERAQDAEPQAVGEALALIGALYRHEELIRERQIEGAEKLAWRSAHSEPIVRAFWAWCELQCQRGDMVPSHPLAKALAYARERQGRLQVFLANPEVPIDTNHLERALRPIPCGRRNWLFCWTEIGAKHVGIIQSLIATCRLHGIDVYTYLVDVLQRVGTHPAKDVLDLTPRVWKTKFAHDPMKSDLALLTQ